MLEGGLRDERLQEFYLVTLRNKLEEFNIYMQKNITIYINYSYIFLQCLTNGFAREPRPSRDPVPLKEKAPMTMNNLETGKTVL